MSAATIEPTQTAPMEGFDANSTAIFHRAFDLYGVLDGEGHILDLRGRIFDRTSAQPDLLVRQPFAESVFWQTSEANVRAVEKALSDAATSDTIRVADQSIRLDFRISSDEKIPLELRFEPIESANDDRRVFVSARTSEASGLIDSFRKESDELILGAEQADIGLWYWDHLRERLYSTPRCNEIFDLAAYEDLSYDKVLTVVHPDDREFVENFFDETRRTGSKYEEEFRVIYSDGRIEWICAQGKSYLDTSGRPERMVGVVRRITKQKMAGEELDRVYERERRAREEAVIANRAKDFFLAFVSHELRSPLNAILGWSRILQSREVDDATRKKAYVTIEKNANIQTKLINDLVDSTRVATGKIKLEYRQCNLVDLVKSCFDAQRPAAENQGLAFEFTAATDNAPVFGDSGRLQQAMGNLLSNAIKFTPNGGKVAVSVRTTEDTAIVEIVDTGQGIDPVELPDIFKQYAQGDAERVRKSGGLGLGLSIVNILITKHGGRVIAESLGLGHGSRFEVTLPLKTGTDTEVPVEMPAQKESGKRLDGFDILIVEDDPDSREVLQLFLEQSGASVRAAESARSAMNLFIDARSKRPDIIISDLAMPEEDGYSLISRIRQLPPEKGGTIPALALSAFASAESRQKAFEAGFHRYLTKPFEPGLIVDQVVALRKLGEEESVV
ncbi:MAG: ATP-binding protein [Pyrinomonadaceae bacterium]